MSDERVVEKMSRRIDGVGEVTIEYEYLDVEVPPDNPYDTRKIIERKDEVYRIEVRAAGTDEKVAVTQVSFSGPAMGQIVDLWKRMQPKDERFTGL
jgi:hypothetical protein